MASKICRLLQYPPKPELAATASLPLLVLTILLLYRRSTRRDQKLWASTSRAIAGPRLAPLATAPIAFPDFVLGVGLFLA